MVKCIYVLHIKTSCSKLKHQLNTDILHKSVVSQCHLIPIYYIKMLFHRVIKKALMKTDGHIFLINLAYRMIYIGYTWYILICQISDIDILIISKYKH